MRILVAISLLNLAIGAEAQTTTSAKTDARLGAGGVARSAGNVVRPGSPTRASVGSIPGPGLPIIQTTSRPASPKPPPPVEPVLPVGHGPVYVPIYFPVYGIEAGSGLVTGPATIPKSRSEHKVAEAPTGDRAVSARPERGPVEYGLIALNGGLIYAASEYRVDGRTLRFLTVQGDQYVVSLDEVDVGFSERLNRERGSEFSLEP